MLFVRSYSRFVSRYVCTSSLSQYCRLACYCITWLRHTRLTEATPTIFNECIGRTRWNLECTGSSLKHFFPFFCQNMLLSFRLSLLICIFPVYEYFIVITKYFTLLVKWYSNSVTDFVKLPRVKMNFIRYIVLHFTFFVLGQMGSKLINVFNFIHATHKRIFH